MLRHVNETIAERTPIARVQVVSTGEVQIRPEHARRTWRPLPLWLLTSRRFTDPLPINAYVIEHRKGLVLFDTGQDRASVTDETYFPTGLPHLTYRRLARFTISPTETLSAGLSRLGYRLADVHTAVLSHLHQDHIGGLRELSSVGSGRSTGPVRIVLSEREWRSLSAPMAELRGLLRQHIPLDGLDWHPVRMRPTDDPSLMPFTSAHDLFGDDSMVLLPTPGHTPGSVSLLVRRPGLAPLMMVGDLTYDIHLLTEGHTPGVGFRRTLSSSTAAVNRFVKRNPDVVILPAHDPGAARRLALSENRAVHQQR
jgi:glyoxylase-like metal-dependent hydrolase (beta-lactamase superfamily II)